MVNFLVSPGVSSNILPDEIVVVVSLVSIIVVVSSTVLSMDVVVLDETNCDSVAAI
jgi:hypothetical protein